jgi:tripartite-type tricarboxylate transporter receptor subunit TctC
MTTSRIWRLLAAALTLGAGAVPAMAQDSGFYSGKRITLVVPFAPGGAYDLYSRLAATYLPKYIPGAPDIVLQHMPGAGGLKAANSVANISPKDGTAMMMPPDSIAVLAVVNPEQVRYKSEEFTWIGTLVQVNSVLVVRADAGAKTWTDLKTTEVPIASTGSGSQSFMIPLMFNEMLGTKLRIVRGYKGSNDVMLAIERGEASGFALAWTSWKTLRADWLKSGYALPLIQVGAKKEADLPNVPMAADLASTPEDRQILMFMSSLAPVGRSLVVPPGVPESRTAVLRAAFDRMVADPAVVADAEKRNLPLNPLSGAEAQRFIGQATRLSPELAERTRKLLSAK